MGSFSSKLADFAVRAHDWSVVNPRVSYITSNAAFVAAWYALPDFCRSKKLRTVAKAAILIAGVANELHVKDVGSFSIEDTDGDVPSREVSGYVVAGVAAGVVIASLSGTVLFEKVMFKRGEKRRAQGTCFAHSRQAIGITAVSAALLALVPEHILLDKSSDQ